MDSKLQSFLTAEFTAKVDKVLRGEPPAEKNREMLFNAVYPLIQAYPRMTGNYDEDAQADFAVVMYEQFASIMAGAARLKEKMGERFVFLYYFLMICKQRFGAIRPKLFQSSGIEYYDFLESPIYASREIAESGHAEMLKKCMAKHLEGDERALFLIYYYEIIDEDDFIFLTDHLSLPPTVLLDLLSEIRQANDNLYRRRYEFLDRKWVSGSRESVKNLDEKLKAIQPVCDEKHLVELFSATVETLRVRIHRIREKMKKLCNYLADILL